MDNGSPGVGKEMAGDQVNMARAKYRSVTISFWAEIMQNSGKLDDLAYLKRKDMQRIYGGNFGQTRMNLF